MGHVCRRRVVDSPQQRRPGGIRRAGLFTIPSIRTVQGAIPERTLGLVLGRHIDGGMHENIDISNYGPKPVNFSLELMI